MPSMKLRIANFELRICASLVPRLKLLLQMQIRDSQSAIRNPQSAIRNCSSSTMQFPEFRRARPGDLPEKSSKIRRVVEPKLIRDLGNVQIGMRQKPLGLQNEPPLKMVGKVASCFLSHQFIQPTPGHAQKSGYFRGARDLKGASVQPAQKTSRERGIFLKRIRARET